MSEALLPGEGATERPAPRVSAPLWLPALFTLAGTLAMHIFVPALPAAGAELGASDATMQMTVTLYLLGMAFGQLVYGPLSDRFGRRPVLMGGLALYVVGGLAAALAPHAGSLVAARLFQALGGCAGLVLGRAIVRDTTEGSEAARRMALMNLLITIGPGLAPILGGAMNVALGWRSILFLLCALGVATLLCAWRLLPETGTRETLPKGVLARHYVSLLRSPAFIGLAIGGSCATTAMYGFVAAAPFIYIDQLGRPPLEVGFYLCALISGVWIGSMLARQLVVRLGSECLIRRGNALSLLGALAFLAGTLLGQLSVPLVVASTFLFSLGAGTASPLALTTAIGLNLKVIGSASGLYGFTQMMVGVLCTALVTLGDDPALATALVLTGAGLTAQVALRLGLRYAARSR